MKTGYRKKVKYNDPPGLVVTVENNIEGAIRRFKRKVKDSQLMLELQDRSYYKKPSKLRREKRALGKLRAQKQTREANRGSGIYS